MNKYRNTKTEYNGKLFDSKKEAEYCKRLDMLKFAENPSEKVVSYELQPKYDYCIEGEKMFTYRADFFVLYADNHSEIVDVKGILTPMFKLKRKIIEKAFNVKIILK